MKKVLVVDDNNSVRKLLQAGNLTAQYLDIGQTLSLTPGNSYTVSIGMAAMGDGVTGYGEDPLSLATVNGVGRGNVDVPTNLVSGPTYSTVSATFTE